MRSVKDIIIGFLLILIGFALSAYSLPVSIAVAVGGLAMVVLGALPKGIGKKWQEETPPEPPAGAEPEPDALQPELLPDILTGYGAALPDAQRSIYPDRCAALPGSRVDAGTRYPPVRRVP